MSTPPETRVLTKSLFRWYAIALILILVVLAGAGALSVYQLDSPESHARQFPTLDAKAVSHFAAASRERHCWVVETDESGRRTREFESPSGGQDFERLILAFLPIRDREAAPPIASTGLYDITILTGNRGVQFRVQCSPTEDEADLLIEHHGQKYSGGNSIKFKAIAESLLQQSE